MFPYAMFLLVGLVNAAPNKKSDSIVVLSSTIMGSKVYNVSYEPADDKNIRDNVHYIFKEDGHSIVQTSLDAPCTALPGGFASPLNGKKGEMFSIAFEEGSPEIWYACAKHCHEGEFGVIFPVKDEPVIDLDPQGKWDAFNTNAKNAKNSFQGVPQEGTPLGSGVGARVIANSGPSGSGLSRAAIGGIVAGAVVFLAIVGMIVWRRSVLLKQRRQAKTKQWAAQKLVLHNPPQATAVSVKNTPVTSV